MCVCVVCLPVCQEISQKQKEFCTMYEVRHVFSLGGGPKKPVILGVPHLLLKPQVPKQRWNNDTFYSVITFWKGKPAVDLEVWWLWSFTAWVVMSVENRIIMAWINQLLTFELFYFFKLWNLGKSFKSNHRFRFPDVLVTTCLRLNCLLVDP